MPMLMLKYGQNSGTEQEMRRAAAIRNGMSWNLGSRWRCRKRKEAKFHWAPTKRKFPPTAQKLKLFMVN